METYITVSFWLGVFALVVNLLTMMMAEFPRHERETLGARVGKTIIGAGFVVWAGMLIYA